MAIVCFVLAAGSACGDEPGKALKTPLQRAAPAGFHLGARTPGSASNATSAPAGVLEAATPTTCLISVRFHQDGRLDMEDLSPRSFTWTGSPRRTIANQGGGSMAAGAAGAGTLAGGASGKLPPPPTAAAAPSPAMPFDGPPGASAILVRRPGAGADDALVVPLDLGTPGEGGGDVADRWREGGTILRAPYYGAGTRYAIVRVGDEGPRVLAEREVTR